MSAVIRGLAILGVAIGAMFAIVLAAALVLDWWANRNRRRRLDARAARWAADAAERGRAALYDHEIEP